MTTNLERLSKYGLPPDARGLDDIRGTLRLEIQKERGGLAREDDVALLCVAQLFAHGSHEDILLIWNAKSASFDLGLSIDVQFLCGSGLAATKEFLTSSSAPESEAALHYLEQCVLSGDFSDWTVEKQIDFYRHYFNFLNASHEKSSSQ